MAAASGIVRTRVGYCGGKSPGPTYRKVKCHISGAGIYYNMIRFSDPFHSRCVPILSFPIGPKPSKLTSTITNCRMKNSWMFSSSHTTIGSEAENDSICLVYFTTRRIKSVPPSQRSRSGPCSAAWPLSWSQPPTFSRCFPHPAPDPLLPFFQYTQARIHSASRAEVERGRPRRTTKSGCCSGGPRSSKRSLSRTRARSSTRPWPPASTPALPARWRRRTWGPSWTRGRRGAL